MGKEVKLFAYFMVVQLENIRGSLVRLNQTKEFSKVAVYKINLASYTQLPINTRNGGENPNYNSNKEG